VLQPEGAVTLESGEAGPFVDIAVALVAGAAFVIELVSVWPLWNFSRVFGSSPRQKF